MAKIKDNRGFGFGLVSGVITTLGMMVGLFSATSSETVVISGILTIAIADAFSDAFGIHVSEESVQKSHKKVWKTTIQAFFSKLFFALTFMIPILLLPLKTAVIVSIIYGVLLIAVYSRLTSKKPRFAVLEHVALASMVVAATYLVGKIIEAMI